MMTSDNSSFPDRLTKIDALTRGDHYYLREEDACFFLGEYTARKGFSYSATNNLIINFKKPMDRRGAPQWKYKGKMIRAAATALCKAIGSSNLRDFTFVPVPPSKRRDDPMYDDRMQQMLDVFADLVLDQHGYRPDIRPLIEQSTNTVAAHDTDVRPTPDDLAELYIVNDAMIQDGCRTRIVICDDVLTTGCHFRAMVTAILRHLPGAEFRGVFLARRVPEAIDIEDFDW